MNGLLEHPLKRPNGVIRTGSYDQSLSGYIVGVLCIPGVTALMPGNVQDARSFDFPVLYEVLGDIEFEQIACGAPEITNHLISGARRLVRQGVKSIVGACGSFGHYQKPVCEATDAIVHMSILTQVPNILAGLKPTQKILLVFAEARTYTDVIKEQCGIAEPDRTVVADLTGSEEFPKFFQEDVDLDLDKFELELAHAIEARLRDDVGAILIQCSDLCPFSNAIRHRFQLPVFDAVGLIRYLHSAGNRA